MKPRAYFARPVTHYNQPWDDNTIQRLQEAGFEVVDPNTPETTAAYKEHGMPVFLDLVATCDVVFYRTFSDGYMGAGVFKEVTEATVLGIPVLRLSTFNAPEGLLDVPQTRERVANGVI